jgi:hypothetical protein
MRHSKLTASIIISSFVNLLRKSKQYIQRSTGMQLRLNTDERSKNVCAIDKGP